MHSSLTSDQQARRDRLVDRFVSSWQLIPPSAEPVLDATQLPPRLELRVKALRKGYFWRAWDDCGRLRFVVMHLDEAAGYPVMEAHFFDESSRMVSAGCWKQASDGRWQLTDRLEGASARWRHSRLRPLLRPALAGRRR